MFYDRTDLPNGISVLPERMEAVRPVAIGPAVVGVAPGADLAGAVEAVDLLVDGVAVLRAGFEAGRAPAGVAASAAAASPAKSTRHLGCRPIDPAAAPSTVRLPPVGVTRARPVR